MSKIINEIHAKVTDKDAKEFKMTGAEIQELDYLLQELTRWRETGLTHLSDPSNTLTDGLSYVRGKIISAKESGREAVRLDINRANSFLNSMEAIQDAIHYSMLGGVPCPSGTRRSFNITFPLDVSVVGDNTDTRYALAYMNEIKSAFAAATSALDERGLWATYPDSSALYLKVDSIRLSAKENQFEGVDGVAIVTINKPLTGFDVATTIRFIVRQMNDWLAEKVRSFTFNAVDEWVTESASTYTDETGKKCVVSLDDALDVSAYSLAPLYERKSDFSVLKERMFDPLSESMVDKDGKQVHSHIVTTVCAEVNGSPGEIVTVEDKVNRKRMSFAFDMTGKLC